MKVSKFFAATGAVALLAGSATLTVGADDTQKGKQERCYGVAAKGKNDCATNAHSCAGQSTEDRHPNEWIYTPAGLCDRIHGGIQKPEKGE